MGNKSEGTMLVFSSPTVLYSSKDTPIQRYLYNATKDTQIQDTYKGLQSYTNYTMKNY